MRRAQDELRLIESANDLRINLSRHTLTIAGHELKLQPQKFFYHVLFCQLRQRSGGPKGDGFVALGDITISDLDAVARSLTNSGLDADELQWQPGYGFLEKMISWVQKPYVDPEF